MGANEKAAATWHPNTGPDRRARFYAAMTSAANLDAVLAVHDEETALIRDTLHRRTASHALLANRLDRIRQQLDARTPDTLVSVRLIREWLDGPTKEDTP